MSALCAGRWELFDSNSLAAHRQAANICAACPMRIECARLLEEARRDQIIAGAANGPQGTWAGILLNPKKGAA